MQPIEWLRNLRTPARDPGVLDPALRILIWAWWLVSIAWMVFLPWSDKVMLMVIFVALPVLALVMGFFFAVPALVAIRSFHAFRAGYTNLAIRLLLVPIAGLGFYLYSADIGNTLRFQVERSNLVAAVDSLRKTGDKPFMHYFIWGGFLDADRGIMFDESDEAGLPPARRSEAWKKKAGYCFYQGRHMGDHFYMVYSDSGCHGL